MAVINKDIAYMALPMSIRRGNPFPVDEYSVWYDLDELNTYAQTSPVAYVGQVVVYVNEAGSTVEAYVIQNTAGTLTKLASTTASGDLTEDVQQLQGDVTNLKAAVGAKDGESTIVASTLWAALEEIQDAYEAADTSLTQKFNDYYTKTETGEQIAAAISSTYKPAGSTVFESLPALGADQEGKVFNILNTFTTTEDFVEGAGSKYPVGTNVVCIEVTDGVYKWDVLAGFYDMSGYYTSAQIDEKLNSKVSAEEGKSLVQDALITKLTGLAEIKSVSSEFELTGEGQLTVQTIEPTKINGLPAALAAKLTGITIGDTPATPQDGVVTIPVATSSVFGVVKSSEAENSVTVDGTGNMAVYSLNISKLVQTPGNELVLDGGNASIS